MAREHTRLALLGESIEESGAILPLGDAKI
jgi:hypothetical protein